MNWHKTNKIIAIALISVILFVIIEYFYINIVLGEEFPSHLIPTEPAPPSKPPPEIPTPTGMATLYQAFYVTYNDGAFRWVYPKQRTTSLTIVDEGYGSRTVKHVQTNIYINVNFEYSVFSFFFSAMGRFKLQDGYGNTLRDFGDQLISQTGNWLQPNQDEFVVSASASPSDIESWYDMQSGERYKFRVELSDIQLTLTYTNGQIQTLNFVSGSYYDLTWTFTYHATTTTLTQPITFYNSQNWAGVVFVPYSSKISRAYGEFVVPSPNGDIKTGASTVFWVGIDGFANNQLIQAGISLADGVAVHHVGEGDKIYAWYEILPAPQTIVALSPNPIISSGDSISIEIIISGASQKIVIRDVTTSSDYQIVVQGNFPAASVEWIAEVPYWSINHTQLYSTNYKQVSFKNIQFTVSGTTYNFESGANKGLLYSLDMISDKNQHYDVSSIQGNALTVVNREWR